MASFIVRRLAAGVLVIFGVVTITFFLMSVVPSDPASQWAGPRATEEQRAQAREELNLDKPLAVQFGIFLNKLGHFDLGESLANKRSVADQMKEFLPPTLELVAVAFILAALIGIPLGVFSAQKKDRLPDHLSRVIAVGAVAMPSFWLAMMLQLIFFRWLRILPLGGQLNSYYTLLEPIPRATGFLFIDTLLAGNVSAFFDYCRHIIMPAIALGAGTLATLARMTRSGMLEIANEDYILAARSYGLGEGIVMWKLGLKNSLGPTVTVSALQLGYILVNTFMIEAIFNWPGIGNYVSTAVTTLDYPAIIAVTLLSAVSYVVLNMIADILVALDPRVRV